MLCDGLGGHGYGDIASKCVTDSLIDSFKNNSDSRSFFETAVEQAQVELLKKQESMKLTSAMKTTMVGLQIDGNKARWSHIGDSRLYYFRNGRIRQRTLDHSVPQVLAIAGDIKDSDIRNHPDRSRLLRAMGEQWQNRSYEVSDWNRLLQGDAFLLCSDGFWELITDDEMERTLSETKNVEGWCQCMRKKIESLARKSMDNYSAIFVRIEV